MKGTERRTLQKVNRQRLCDLGLPCDLFSDGFQEREAGAKLRELALIDEFERRSLSGDWNHLSLPFAQIIESWRAAVASPTHFASIGPSPRWKKALNTAGEEWRRISSGEQRTAWREYRRKQITKSREAQGKPPPKFKV